MKSYRTLIVFCFATMVVSPCLSQLEQPMFGGGITVAATERSLVKPEKLRLVMWIQAQGKDPKAAVTSLNEHKDRVKTELASMKAVDESIQFSAARVASDKSKNNMQQMMMMNNSGGRKKSKPAPSIFTAKCALKAEWPLPIKEGDALALLPATLLEQIESRDLEGKNNKADLGAAEKERLEEMEQLAQASYYSDGNHLQGPQIAFTAIVADEQIEQASQKAFQAAVKKAETLCKSTSVKMGKLISLSRSQLGHHPLGMPEAIYSPYAENYGGPESIPKGFIDNSEQTMAAKSADELSLSITVTLTYAIE